MISTDNNSITFTSKTFHWWPFSIFDAHYPGFGEVLLNKTTSH